MRLNAAASSSNSSPVRISARCSTSPSRTAFATSRKCFTGFTITYRTTAHSENIDRNPTTIAAVHRPARFLASAFDRLLVVDRHADHRHQVAFLELRIRRRAQRLCGNSRTTLGVHRLVVLVHLPAVDRVRPR